MAFTGTYKIEELLFCQRWRVVKIYSVILILFFISLTAMAEEISINPDSDIAAEIEDATAGEDVLVFEPGEYEINLVIDKNIELRGRDTTNTVLKAKDDDEPVISFNSATNATIRKFTFQENSVAVRVFDASVSVTIDIGNNVFDNNKTAIELGDASTINIENNTFFNNDVAIVSNDVESIIEVYQNIFADNATTLDLQNSDDIRYNCFDETLNGFTGSNGNIVAAPEFVDQVNGDFHLTEDSNCIDEGESDLDVDGSITDLGAFGGQNADQIPHAVTITELQVSGNDSIFVRWEENLDYRVEGYKVYYSNSELKGLNSFDDRKELDPFDATTTLETTIVGLDLTVQTPEAPVISSISPRNEKLIVRWNKPEHANAYTLYYQPQSGSENLVELGDVDEYTITGLSNGTVYDVWLIAHQQKQFHFQVAAYLEDSTDNNFRESSFVLDDEVVNIGDKVSSGASTKEQATPEKIVAFPDLPNEGCFIATAAFGFYSAHEVQILRDFRDDYLLTNYYGKHFVDWYYQYGPKAAGFINEYEILKPIVRAGLYPLIIAVQLINRSFTAFILLFLFLIGLSSYLFMKLIHNPKAKAVV